MEQEKVLLTQSGLEKLEQERDNLINVERPKVIEELQLARSQGDLSENADYDAAREKQAHLESRIKEIDYIHLCVFFRKQRQKNRVQFILPTFF